MSALLGGGFTDVRFVMLHNTSYYSLSYINIKYLTNESQWNYKIDEVLVSKFYLLLY